METAKIDARKILSESNRSLNEEMQEKKNKIQKQKKSKTYFLLCSLQVFLSLIIFYFYNFCLRG